MIIYYMYSMKQTVSNCLLYVWGFEFKFVDRIFIACTVVC